MKPPSHLRARKNPTGFSRGSVNRYSRIEKAQRCGTRIIIDYAYDMQTLWKVAMPILDVEEEIGFNKMLAKKIVDIISVLPNLEG